MRTQRKFLALIMAFMLSLLIFPITALAVQNGAVLVSTEEALKQAITEASGTEDEPTVIEVSADVTLSSGLAIPSGKHIRLVGASDGVALIASEDFTGTMLNMESNEEPNCSSLVLENIILNADRVKETIYQGRTIPEIKDSSKPLRTLAVRKGCTLTIESGTVITGGAEWGGGIYVPAGGNVIMNGGSLTMNVAYSSSPDNSMGGAVLLYGGNFTLNDGTIYRNASADGGAGVLVQGGSVFTMKGGTIEENVSTSKAGGGVRVADNSRFIMTGGSIKNNIAWNDGGGVFFSSKNQFYIGGDINITGNQDGQGTDDNCHGASSSSVIILESALSENSRIGLNPGTEDDKWRTLVQGADGLIPSVENFVSDNAAYTLYFDSTEQAIKPAKTVTVTFHANYDSPTESSVQKIPGGQETVLTANSFRYEDHKFEKWNTASDGSGTPYENEGTVTFDADTNLYAVWTDCEHSTKVYTANGAVISEACKDCGHKFGTATIIVPASANLIVDGTEKKVAQVVYDENWTASKELEVTYSATPVTAGNYTASISMGSATASVGFELKDPTPVPTPTPTPSRPSNSGSSSVSTGYPVTASNAKNGTVIISPRHASKGATVTITAKPNDGYQLDILTVTDKDGKSIRVTEGTNGKYFFTMPSSKVTVEATFAKIEETPKQNFADVPAGYWAENAIAWASENGYINGNTAATFNPEGTVTRQQLWMILARLSGEQPADFAAAKDWAVSNWLSDGTTPGTAVSRQQLVTILYRYAVGKDYDTADKADLTQFPDHASVAAYATDAMAWSVANGIVGGTTQGTLDPNGTATRAQFTVILNRFCQKIAG